MRFAGYLQYGCLASIVLASGCATKASKQSAYDVAANSETAEIRITGTRIKRRVRIDGRDPGLGIPVDVVTRDDIERAGSRSTAGAITGR